MECERDVFEMTYGFSDEGFVLELSVVVVSSVYANLRMHRWVDSQTGIYIHYVSKRVCLCFSYLYLYLYLSYLDLRRYEDMKKDMDVDVDVDNHCKDGRWVSLVVSSRKVEWCM